MNPFQVLGVQPNSDLDSCKKAYRRLSKVHHPDRGGDPENFHRIQEAWNLIKCKGYSVEVEMRLTHLGLFTFSRVNA